MKDVFLVAAATVGLISYLPYIIDTIKGRTKPRIVTWFNWSLLTALATAAAYSDKQYPSAVITLVDTILNMAIVFLSLRYGVKELGFFDVACQVGAITGFVLWIIFNRPLIAIIAAVGIDFMAALPTIKHAWQKPREETAVTFILSVIAAGLTLLATHRPHLSGILWPIYIICMDGFISVLLLERAKPTISA